VAKRAPKPAQAKKNPDGKDAQAYKHTKEKLLLRPDVGLQPQFRPKKPPKTYRYDPSLDPALSWDINADRERGEAIIASIETPRTSRRPRPRRRSCAGCRGPFSTGGQGRAA